MAKYHNAGWVKEYQVMNTCYNMIAWSHVFHKMKRQVRRHERLKEYGLTDDLSELKIRGVLGEKLKETLNRIGQDISDELLQYPWFELDKDDKIQFMFNLESKEGIGQVFIEGFDEVSDIYIYNGNSKYLSDIGMKENTDAHIQCHRMDKEDSVMEISIFANGMSQEFFYKNEREGEIELSRLTQKKAEDIESYHFRTEMQTISASGEDGYRMEEL